LQLVAVVEELDGLFKADCNEPMAIVAIWMKKSFQVWTASWGGWTSSFFL
jgi:hypothetical protein